MFFRTEEEFAINDLGYVTERIPIQIPPEMQADYMNAAKMMGKELYGIDDLDKIAKREIENRSSYLDTCIWFPLSSNLAVAVVHSIFIHSDLIKIAKMGITSALMPHLCIPEKKFINEESIRLNKEKLPSALLIEKYKDDNDQYFYKTNCLNVNETMHWNLLTLNETFQYLAIKTPKNFVSTVKQYNILKSNGFQNMKKDYSGFVKLLSKLETLQ